jgi:hypothetical protein
VKNIDHENMTTPTVNMGGLDVAERFVFEMHSKSLDSISLIFTVDF